MSNAKGLGKGLGALMDMFDEDMDEIIGKSAAVKNDSVPEKEKNIKNDAKPIVPRGTISTDPQGAQEIDINLIDNNTSQPRRAFNADEMHELEQSIAVHGVLQPILLKKVGSRYMIVAGERRWRAARSVGHKTIPALVRDYTSKQIAEISLVENLMRSDLNEIDIALGMKKLMDTYLMTQEQVSNVLGKSRSAVANSLRLLNLPQEVQTLLEQKQITMGHAKCLASMSDKIQMIALARRCADGNMTVRELETVSSGRNWNKALTPPKLQSLELKEFIHDLTKYLMTKVAIQGDEKHGKIIIEYSSTSELERIKNKLK